MALFEGGPVIQKRQRAAAVQNLAGFHAVFESVCICVHLWLKFVYNSTALPAFTDSSAAFITRTAS